MLYDKISKDMIEAMKNHEKERLTVIRMVKASLKQEQIDHKKEINDDLLIDVVNKQIKMRNDSIEEFKKAGRDDLIEQTKGEIEVLSKYLPKQLKFIYIQCVNCVNQKMKYGLFKFLLDKIGITISMMEQDLMNFVYQNFRTYSNNDIFQVN